MFSRAWAKPKALSDSTQYFKTKKDFSGLRNYARRQVAQFEKKGRKSWPQKANSLLTLGDAYRRLGELDSARKFYSEALNIKKQCHPNEPHLWASTYISLGILEMRSARFYEAELYLKSALERAKTDVEVSKKLTSGIWYHLGTVYVRLGQFDRAKNAYLTSLSVAQASDLLEADVWNGLGTLYLDWGQYPQADSCYGLVLQYTQARHGPTSSELLYPVINLGNLNFRMGRYDRSEQYFLRALDLILQNPQSPPDDRADLFNNLGVLYLQTGQYPKAAEYLEKALAIKQNIAQGLDLEAAATILNVGNIHFKLGSYSKAQQFFEQAKEAYLSKLEKDHPDMADIYANLGAVYMNTQQWIAADSFYHKAFFISKKTLGDLHPRTFEAAHQLAFFYWCSGQKQKAFSHFAFYHQQVLRYISRYFIRFTEDQKEKFAEKLQVNEEGFKSFCASEANEFPELKKLLLEHELAMKGLLFDYAKAWRTHIHYKPDSVSLPGFQRWKSLQDSIYLLVTAFGSDKINQVDALIEESEMLEKQWQDRLNKEHSIPDRQAEIKTEHISKALKPGEAAVQVVRFHRFSNYKVDTDSSVTPPCTFPVFGKSDTVQYAFLIVRPGHQNPELIWVGNGNELEGSYWHSFYKSVQKLKTDAKAYSRFWKPLQSRLTGTKVVYFSGDGVYHKLNPDALFIPERSKYLCELVQVKRCISLRDLLQPHSSKGIEKNQKTILLGNPNFQMPDEGSSNIPARYAGLFPAEGPAPLPGSKKEVEQIAELLKKQKMPVSLLTDDLASENHLKQLQNPGIVHLATHGFFNSDLSGFYNPLYKTGLILSEFGKKKQDDGILTAHEAMQLSLSQTSLVVLSACETGMGDIKSGEGIMGLQRAFQMAGARSIIMSLWKVSDEVSEKFMIRFYVHLISGKNKRTAFALAQAEIRNIYKQPYFWAAYCMVGD